MTLSKFQADLRQKILQQLEMGPHSIAELAATLNYNYYSVRQQIRSLELEGVLKPVGNSYRNVRFTFASDNGPNNIIPMLRSDNNSFKLQELMDLKSDSRASEAVKNLPRHVTRIMKAAFRLSEGRDMSLTIHGLKAEMLKDLEALKKMVVVYEQILEDERNWNPEYLKRYPNDATYDPVKVDQSYLEFFPTER